MWNKLKKVGQWLSGKSVTIGYALITVSEVVPDETASAILKTVGVLIGGAGAVDNLKKGRYKTKQ